MDFLELPIVRGTEPHDPKYVWTSWFLLLMDPAEARGGYLFSLVSCLLSQQGEHFSEKTFSHAWILPSVFVFFSGWRDGVASRRCLGH